MNFVHHFAPLPIENPSRRPWYRGEPGSLSAASLTVGLQQPLGLIGPLDADQVDGDPGEGDQRAHTYRAKGADIRHFVQTRIHRSQSDPRHIYRARRKKVQSCTQSGGQYFENLCKVANFVLDREGHQLTKTALFLKKKKQVGVPPA